MCRAAKENVGMIVIFVVLLFGVTGSSLDSDKWLISVSD